MSRERKLLLRLLSGTSDPSFRFDELCLILRQLGFSERVRGDHFIFSHDGVREILNLQPEGRSAKPYQIKQVRHVILRYGLGGEDDDEV